MKKRIAIGTSNFKEIIDENSLYIDKTLFIKELIDDASKALCFLRPRRFGKTLNLSMLDYYFNIKYKDNNLFNGLKIMEQGEKYLREMNKYPIISLSFKSLKCNSYSEFINEYKEMIWKLYEDYLFLLDSDKISKDYKNLFQEYYYKKNDNLMDAISNLMIMLKCYYNKEVIVLLDEYDAPILYAYENGYYDEIITFINQLFETTFKDNNNLEKGIIIGIIGMTFGDIFGGANNIDFYNLTDSKFSEYFGFTESEVDEVLEEYKLSSKDIKKYYNGYLFGDLKIYNPWDILNYLDDELHILKSYWTETGNVELLRKLVFRVNDNSTILNNFHELLETGKLEHITLDLFMDLKGLKTRKNTIWTLFMLNGYLTPIKFVTNPNDATLIIPNLEIRENLQSLPINWMAEIGICVNFAEIFKVGNIRNFKSSFEIIVRKGFSYYNVPKRQKGENFYHSFIMALLYGSTNRIFDIKYNYEPGEGRYDLVLKPNNNSSSNSYIIVFKTSSSLRLSKEIKNSFKEIEKLNYQESLKEYNVTLIEIAYIGKKFKIETKKITSN